jgi:3'-5' exoribonuclease 1
MANHYYIIIDFECTCWEDRSFALNEIIEFPAIVMNSKTLQVEFEFHRYVRPIEHPILSDFCTELTGIEQDDIKFADTLDTVLDDFTEFLTLHKIHNFTMCTDGPWDFAKFLHPETKRKEIEYPEWGKHWIDLRRRFQRSFRLDKWQNVDRMLKMLGMEFQGRPHSGIDDARNIARIASALHKRDKVDGKMRPNRSIRDRF